MLARFVMDEVISDGGPWTLGTLIAFPLGILLALTFAVAAFYIFRTLRQEYETFERWAFSGITGISAVAIAGVTFGSMYPYDTEYHQWHRVAGTVDRVESRQVAAGDGMSERFVVLIEGHPFAVDDTRAALLEPGDDVVLRCKREWEYLADSGWGCRWSR